MIKAVWWVTGSRRGGDRADGYGGPGSPEKKATMTWKTRPGRDRWDRDPEYIRNRAIIRAQRRPCARCGGVIAYDEPHWIVVNGKRKVNPRAFHCGHILSRAKGGSHALANLQAEHAGCSMRAGSSDGARTRNGSSYARPKVWPQLDTSRRW